MGCKLKKSLIFGIPKLDQQTLKSPETELHVKLLKKNDEKMDSIFEFQNFDAKTEANMSQIDENMKYSHI